MHQNELIKRSENLPATAQQPVEIISALTQDAADLLCRQRKNSLERIKSLLSLKFYNKITDKIEQERSILMKLLNWQDAKQDALSQYSFVLNPSFFEQKFLSI